ncbi:hypothetical protein C5Y96_21745 [Blastopirellula marina]|uniref:Uracil-DNA glycosylase-like domain-containing protein n=1 Tax=Blastopirellula marina TaxID=124 RepID=A0A2S8F1N3_9BACT|nr:MULTISPECIES: hypothetical protein [Pirellulaceae]PQO26076.1 hypothetical protein C5Y96_21745 [Blastopirellula marina]RCS44434.1 hypothetical protein DTL36_21790 [Bremerella cremea]
MPDQPASDSVETLLDDMLQDVGHSALKYSTWKNTVLSAFLGTTGSDYQNELMIVGRALNGNNGTWLPPEMQDQARRSEVVENAAHQWDNRGLNWVLKYWKQIRACEDCQENYFGRKSQCPKCRSSKTKRLYCTRTSAFWRVIRHVVRNIPFPESLWDTWANHVAWTNLYKISPSGGGNPTTSLRQLQHPYCEQILRLEIQAWQPRRILFLSGYDWMNHFCEGLGIAGQITENAKFVQFAGTLTSTGAKVVVGPHPQDRGAKPERDFAKEIATYFRQS